MASSDKLLLHLVASLCAVIGIAATSDMFPMSCTIGILYPPCWATLYHANSPGSNLEEEQIAAFYSVGTSQIRAIMRESNQDYLVSVPCFCQNVNGSGFFYDAPYEVQAKDTFVNVSDAIYSGQAWDDGSEERKFVTGQVVTMNLVCGCVAGKVKSVVTYTVQEGDTLSIIATRLGSSTGDIVSLNKKLIQDPHFIEVGWVLFVPSLSNV